MLDYSAVYNSLAYELISLSNICFHLTQIVNNLWSPILDFLFLILFTDVRRSFCFRLVSSPISVFIFFVTYARDRIQKVTAHMLFHIRFDLAQMSP